MPTDRVRATGAPRHSAQTPSLQQIYTPSVTHSLSSGTDRPASDDPLGPVTALSATSLRARGLQVLSVLLALVVGLQGLPLQSALHLLHDAPAHEECTHPKGVCPMNPGGPCECDHDRPSPDVPDEPTLRPCDGGASDGVFSSTPAVWRPVSADRMPLPRASSIPRPVAPSSLSSQRAGDDVFHPPRPRAADRPGATLPVPLRT